MRRLLAPCVGGAPLCPGSPASAAGAGAAGSAGHCRRAGPSAGLGRHHSAGQNGEWDAGGLVRRLPTVGGTRSQPAGPGSDAAAGKAGILVLLKMILGDV